ncbi:MAG: porin family protein [Chitinophagaceae bacterium]
MKKVIAFFIFTGIITVSHAQYQFGIFAGPQISSAKYTITGIKQPTSNKYGFQAGVGFKIPFENHLYFSPAAFYSLKGYKVKFNQRAFPPDLKAIDNDVTLHTFELAFLLQYDFSMQANHFFLKLGPSLDFQLSGREKFNLENGNKVSRKMVFQYTDYGRYAANMLLHLGYETSNGLIISAQYSHGLASINNADGGPGIRHRVYGISIGKYIGKKKIVLDTSIKE